MFLSTFASADTSFISSAVSDSPIVKIQIQNLILDELYATRDILLKFTWKIPANWTYNTFLHALFQNNTMAGNVSYTESVVEKIKIKRRYQGEFEWKTLHEKEIRLNEDFNIEYFDYYAPAKRKVEYAYVAVIGGVDSDAISTEVYSDFDSYFICDNEKSYPLILDTTNDIELNRETTVIKTLGNKYPYVNHNGLSRYYSGTMSVTFIELLDDFDVDNGWKYRNEVDDFLSSEKAKILKNFEGEIYMVDIVNNIKRTQNGHYQNVSHTFDWVECGNPNKISDLYDNGFIDVDVDRE